MEGIVSYFKFLIKTRVVSPLRSFFISIFGGRVNILGWEDRLLLINLEALGDLVVFTSVLKHYKKRFPQKKIYLLIKKGIGIEDVFRGAFADEVLAVDYRTFSINPFYGAGVLRSLRKIGFQMVINHDFSAAEINGKWIAVGLGAEEIIRYEGIGAEFTQPFDVHQRNNLRVVMEKMYPRYTRVISSIDALAGRVQEFPSALRHYVAIYEGATGFREEDYSICLPVSVVSASSSSSHELHEGGYAILGIAASVPYKRWPLDRFAEVTRFLKQKNMNAVIVGSSGEKPLAGRFASICGGGVVNKVGQTSLGELLVLIKHAACVVSNDTSLVHLAVALKIPSVCITGGGQFGMFSNYGYKHINRWVYKKSPCFGDNWRCGKGLPPDTPSPCIAAIGAEEVIQEISAALVAHKNSAGEAGKFELGSAGEAAARSLKKEQANIKVIYAGIQAENYNPKRYPSFEYATFFLTLKGMEGVSVIEYPYDPIIGMGKKRFNEKLLEFVRREKPDVFFAFMFSDEFDPATLDEIKKLTKSIAWFADDQRRIHNYSRLWAPHFTAAVTTWFRGPETYARYGINTVIRSQWACRAPVSRRNDAPQNIDVSFIGQRTAARAKIINQLRGAGIHVFVRGFGWSEGRVGGEEMEKIIRRSKINLNINDTPSPWSPWSLGQLFLRRSIDGFVPSFRFMRNFKFWRAISISQIKARPFELSGRGAFVISGYADDLETYYTEDEEMVFYRNASDLVKKIKQYAPLEAERAKIAAAGYERTLREHTYEKRFRDLFRAVGLKF